MKQLLETLFLTLMMCTDSDLPTDVIWMNKMCSVSLGSYFSAVADAIRPLSTHQRYWTIESWTTKLFNGWALFPSFCASWLLKETTIKTYSLKLVFLYNRQNPSKVHVEKFHFYLYWTLEACNFSVNEYFRKTYAQYSDQIFSLLW